jgi:hypothetical protein
MMTQFSGMMKGGGKGRGGFPGLGALKNLAGMGDLDALFGGGGMPSLPAPSGQPRERTPSGLPTAPPPVNLSRARQKAKKQQKAARSQHGGSKRKR